MQDYSSPLLDVTGADVVDADIKPVNLPVASLSRDAYRLSEFIGDGIQSEFACQGESLRLRLEFTQTSQLTTGARVMLDGDFGVITVADGGDFIRVMTAVHLDGGSSSSDTCWPWLQGHIIHGLRCSPFSRVHGVRLGDCITDTGKLLRMRLSSDSHSYTTLVCASEQSWLSFLKGSEWKKNHARPTSLPDIEVRWPLLLGEWSCRQARLRQVRAGDILFPDVARFDCAGTGWTEYGGCYFQIKLSEPGIINILKLGKTMDMLDMPVAETEHHWGDEKAATVMEAMEEEASKEMDAALHAVDDISIQLQFQLGQVCTSIKTLQRISPGSVLLLKAGSPAAIDIRAGETSLGSGEVVEVEGRLAIRVTRWGAQA